MLSCLLHKFQENKIIICKLFLHGKISVSEIKRGRKRTFLFHIRRKINRVIPTQEQTVATYFMTSFGVWGLQVEGVAVQTILPYHRS